MALAISRIRASMVSSTSRVKVRTVPSSVQVSGMTLLASPARKIVTLMTLSSMGLRLRLTML